MRAPKGLSAAPASFLTCLPLGPQPTSQVPLSPPLPHLLWIPCPFTSFPDPNAQLSNGCLHRDCPSSAQTQCIQKQIHCPAFKGSSAFKNYSFYPGDIILPVNHFTSVVPCRLKHSQTPSPDNSRDSEFNLPFQRPLPCTTVLTVTCHAHFYLKTLAHTTGFRLTQSPLLLFLLLQLRGILQGVVQFDSASSMKPSLTSPTFSDLHLL